MSEDDGFGPDLLACTNDRISSEGETGNIQEWADDGKAIEAGEVLGVDFPKDGDQDEGGHGEAEGEDIDSIWDFDVFGVENAGDDEENEREGKADEDTKSGDSCTGE